MNLIQQLQQIPKWEEFEEWYKRQDYSTPFESNKLNYIIGFDELHPDFQKGVFEKFIEKSNDYLITSITSELGVHSITIEYNTFRILFYSFEELLIWYFNN